VQTRPLLLAIMDKFAPDQITSVLTAMVSWAVRLLISGKQGSGALETVYGTAAEEVTQGKHASAREVAKKILPQIPNNTQFESDFAVANVGKAHLARYYLRAMERQEMNDPEPYQMTP